MSSCGICLKEPDEPVKCSTCNFTGCANCIIEWYRLTMQKSVGVECSCPACRGQNTFPVTVPETISDDDSSDSSEDDQADWVDVGIVEGDVITPQQYDILPEDFTRRWVFQPMQMEIDGQNELVGYMVLSRQNAMRALLTRIIGSNEVNDTVVVNEVNNEVNERREKPRTEADKANDNRYILNPDSNRYVLKSSPVGKKVVLSQDPRYILNPRTNRYVLKTGKIGRKLI